MNPELRRNLWLELSLHRLLALPIALALAFMLVLAMADADPLTPLAVTAASLFVGFALWGGVHTGDAVMGEVRARTWDGQRMSAIEPWAMTWGKLLGAPAFAWYGGVPCLVVYLSVAPARNAPKLAAFMLAGALLVHAIALIGSIVAARKSLVRSSASGWVLGIVLVIVAPWLSILSSGENDISWWGRDWQRIDFMVLSTAAFAGWAVFGAHRLMCQELRVRTVPWAWVAFLLFLSAYIAGFAIRESDTPGQQTNVFLIATLLVSLASLYPLLLSEASGAMVVRRMVLRFSAREWRRLLEEMPLWPVTLGVALVFCVLTVLFAGPRIDTDDLLRTGVLAPVPLFLLATRDAAICVFFALSRQPRRTEAAVLFYLALLYWLIPTLLRAAGAGGIADLVLPPFWERPGYAAIVAAGQAVLAISAAVWRWRKNYGSG